MTGKAKMIKFGIVAHGGAGSPEEYSDGCMKACASGFRMLESGKSSLEAVVEAVRILLARAVLDTPHVALAGRGAEEFAREIGFKPF